MAGRVRQREIVVDVEFPSPAMYRWFRQMVARANVGEWLPDGSLRVLRPDRYRDMLAAAEGREILVER